MSIRIGSHQFEGPYTSTDFLEDRSGIYAILQSQQGGYGVIDIGESSAVRSRVENHDRKQCWTNRAHGKLHVAVFYTPFLQQPGRKDLEQDLRDQFDPPCGKD